MRVFVTGASGWIGSATVDELLAAGHEVTGLARSDASAAALQAKGVRVCRGDLDDLASIRAGAEAAEAVNHHPDITINYNKVKLSLTSHDSGGVTQRDVRMAGKINEIATA